MTAEEIKIVLDKHAAWLRNEYGGEKADLSGADLRGANLSRANLSGAHLSVADLSEAHLRKADLSVADLRGANLSRANLSGADLSGADLSGANLSGAHLSGADLSEAHLRGADLSRANLSGADLSRANLSGAKGILSATEWLARFETDDFGIIVFRAENGQYAHPAHWEFKDGAFLTEVPNPDRCTTCGCGVSFATQEWVRENTNGKIWACRIRWIDLADVVVPFNTDGKARCARLELIEEVER